MRAAAALDWQLRNLSFAGNAQLDGFAARMIREAGFGRVQWRNLSMGIAALHSGWKL